MRETNRASDEMNRDLSEQVANALDAFANERVSVRVVTASDDLIAVFSGTLGPRSDEKSPSLFWPVEVDAQLGECERPGIYAHLGALEDVRVHIGGFVVEFLQAGVTVNVRQLGPAGP